MRESFFFKLLTEKATKPLCDFLEITKIFIVYIILSMRGDIIESDKNKVNDENTEYYNETIKDMQDMEILEAQSQAQIILALGYLLEYKASNQAMEIIRQRMAKRNSDKAAGNYENEEEKLEQEEKKWINEGLNADKTALIAAEFELYGQIILTNLDYIKLQRLPKDINRRDLMLTTTANDEIFYGAVFGLIGFMLNYKGVKILYDISNENVTFD
ncbi:hypothetical protein [Clostridium butyricum]|uniref:hypothetical protein n=2 Tax=Clostridium butyricum TaxID=1492 RepID=UPI002AB1BDED|nr:hypothetical protein [Clostridium butyricum]